MFKRIKEDIGVVFDRDPAARSMWEVLLCYPGLHAICLYRISHWFFIRDFILIPRMISNLARFLTGVEIHPGATIGRGLFIDHGSGIVIGETAELGDNVVVATGAKVLGSFYVGENSKIGAGSVVLKAVPPNSTVVGIPGQVVWHNGKKIEGKICEEIDLEHDNLPDPVAEMMNCMQRNMQRLEQRITQLEEERNNHGTTSV